MIYQTGNTWDSIRTKLQLDLNNIIKWTSSNSLALNADKTVAMLYSPRGKLSKLRNLDSIMISNAPVKFMKQYIYLGIILDSEMSLQQLVKKH